MLVVCTVCGTELEPQQVGLCPVCGGDPKIVEEYSGTKTSTTLVVTGLVSLAVAAAGGLIAGWTGVLVGLPVGLAVSVLGLRVAARVRKITR